MSRIGNNDKNVVAILVANYSLAIIKGLKTLININHNAKLKESPHLHLPHYYLPRTLDTWKCRMVEQFEW